MARVIANLLVGANLATCEAGRSKALSFPADRSLFHALRARANAILIGGATYRSEPYSTYSKPLLVSTKDPGAFTKPNPATEFMAADPMALVEIALERFQAPILIEGGVNFLAPLLMATMVDELNLARSPNPGDSHFFEMGLLSKYRQIDDRLDPNSQGRFQIWIPS